MAQAVWQQVVTAGAVVPFVPSPLAGEGGSVLTRILMGEGSALQESYPSPRLIRFAAIHVLSRKGEGAVTSSAARGDATRCDISRLHLSNSRSRSRGAFAPEF